MFEKVNTYDYGTVCRYAYLKEAEGAYVINTTNHELGRWRDHWYHVVEKPHSKQHTASNVFSPFSFQAWIQVAVILHWYRYVAPNAYRNKNWKDRIITKAHTSHRDSFKPYSVLPRKKTHIHVRKDDKKCCGRDCVFSIKLNASL